MSYDKFGHITVEAAKDIVLNQACTTTYKYVYSTTLPWHVEKLAVVGPRADVPDTIVIDYWAADTVCVGTGTGQDKGCRGKVKSVTNALGQITHYEAYWYNALGQRVRKTGQDTTYYFYDAEGRVLGEYDRNGSAIQETVYLDNMPVVVLKPEQGSTVPYYIYADHINTPQQHTACDHPRQ
jgi:hypothetical protein